MSFNFGPNCCIWDKFKLIFQPSSEGKLMFAKKKYNISNVKLANSFKEKLSNKKTLFMLALSFDRKLSVKKK